MKTSDEHTTFLLENTVFQNVLQDLQLNVLYIENGCKHQQTIENIHQKCMFIANSFEEGELLFQKNETAHYNYVCNRLFSNKIYKEYVYLAKYIHCHLGSTNNKRNLQMYLQEYVIL